MRKLEADLKRFRDQDEAELRKERERNSWWSYVTSPIYGKEAETAEQKLAREKESLHRRASMRIKGSQLDEKNARLKRLEDLLLNVNIKITTEKQEAEAEKKHAEDQARAHKWKTEQEARNREMQERRERQVREWAEELAKRAREAQAAREAQERAREAAAEQRRKDEQERARVAEERRRQMDEDLAKFRADQAKRDKQEHVDLRNRTSNQGSRSAHCQHNGWWSRVEGEQTCSNCHTLHYKFALRCPGCAIIACASCRYILQGKQPREKVGGGTAGRARGRGRGRGKGHGFGGRHHSPRPETYDDAYEGVSYWDD